MKLASHSISYLCRDCFSYGYAGGQTQLQHCTECASLRIVQHAELFELHLAHMDCDAFYCSVEKRDNPELAEKPVIVGGGDRGVVAAACYVARQYGIRSAMPSWRAKQACSELVVLKPRMAHYQKISRQIKQMMLSLTPLVQSLSIDEAFVDMSGTEKLHKKPAAVMLAQFQADVAKQIGITVSVGLSYNKSLAKISSDQDKPHGYFVLGTSQAQSWLATQPCSIIFGLGKRATARLQAENIHSVGDIQNAPLLQLQSILGNDAARIKALASGQDERAVLPSQKAKSISSETTFASDISDLESLLAIAERQSQNVSKQLKQKSVQGRTVTLKLKTAAHKIITRSVTIGQPTQMAFRIFSEISRLLEKQIDGKTKYRLLGVGVELSSEIAEASFFTDEHEHLFRKEKLEQAVDSIHSKLGQNSITTGRQLGAKPSDRDSPKTK
ncbi:MAG: DNA polymerase IV [Candidatus Puniceispirillaceae bacterium]